MNPISNISIRSKISLGIAALIMLTFFSVQSCIVFGICENSMMLAQFGYGCIIAFMPPFFMVVGELLKNIRLKEENVNAQLEAISKSNLVVTMTMDGKILSANDNFCDIMGCPEKNIVNKPHSAMVTPEYAKSKDYLKFWDTLRKGESITGEFERVAKDGSKKWLFGNYTPIMDEDGDYTTILKIATDITTQHEAEVIVNQKILIWNMLLKF